MNAWRLIESPPADIFSQMALDRELFEEFIQDPDALPLLRIYRVAEPALTVGRPHRKVALRFFYEKNFCLRPTGGGLVRHGKDLLYSVIARRDSFSMFGQVRTSYLSFHEAIQDALLHLGIKSRLFRCDEARLRNRNCFRRASKLSDCFKEPVATDVLVNERKIAGGGQWRRCEGFLHQGSIQFPEGITFDDLRKALRGAFQRKFGIVWKK